jgi:AhpD family alkylhydroperoxidase
VLEAYLNFKETLAQGVLSPKLRERIALTVAEANGCDYCLAAHSAVGRIVGLSDEEIQDSRKGVAPESKMEAALRFVHQIVEKRGRVTDDSISRLRRAGYRDEEIIEIIANVVLSLFTNYINLAAHTAVDFPAVEELKAV